jgi:hypothetical protein
MNQQQLLDEAISLHNTLVRNHQKRPRLLLKSQIRVQRRRLRQYQEHEQIAQEMRIYARWEAAAEAAKEAHLWKY